MSDYSKLTDAEVNAKLAEKMGWKIEYADWNCYRWRDNAGNKHGSFSPCTSRDDLAVVVGHIVESGLSLAAFSRVLTHFDVQESLLRLLTCPPRVIAEACLEVLGG